MAKDPKDKKPTRPNENPDLSRSKSRRRVRASAAGAKKFALQASFEPAVPGPRLAPLPPVAPESAHLRLPPVSDVRCFHTTRPLPAKYSESVLTRIADNDADLQLIFALDSATNDRLLAEGNQRLAITPHELVFAVPYCRIINAAFTHPHPQGARFSTPYRGAWYAGLELGTAKAEVLFHRSVQFSEINWQQPEELEYDQYTADFSGCFHDLRPAAFACSDPAANLNLSRQPDWETVLFDAEYSGETKEPAQSHAWEAGARLEIPPTRAEFASCLAPDSYVDSQQLAIHLHESGSLGILYPSRRRQGGNCIACFRPSLVANVRKRDLYRLRWYPDRAATFVRSPRVPPSADTPAVAGRSAETS